MAKFYIESGNVKVIKTGEDFLTITVNLLREMFKQNVTVKLGEGVSVSECGFIGEFIEQKDLYSIEYFNQRRNAFREIDLFEYSKEVPKHLRENETLFLKTRQLLKVAGLPGKEK